MVRIFNIIVTWGWCPILITVLALLGVVYQWPMELVAPVLGVVLVIGLVVAVISAREQQLERSSQRLKQLAGYFNRRFMGSSSLSIFTIIDTLYNVDNPQLWDWARACDMSQRVFNTWYNAFIDRLESDTRTGRFSIYLRIYLNEFWSANNLYYEFIEQFHDIAEKVEIPVSIIDQFNRFAMEYNTFAGSFQETIAELKRVARTEIEPPSVKMVSELVAVKPVPKSQDREAKPTRTTQGGGYYM
ncbi:MAG: hypothetical protein JSW16_03985 [Dehalococcoidales bacterium]|nr:MAG: hypothetical protein JSW16_03985 [Dehalococcoidales bacterium]